MNKDIEPPFPIWQGFRHTWTYNHRLNRLGDWMEIKSREGDEVVFEMAHSAASGTGEDEATFSSYAATTRANGVYFKEFKRHITISGTEEEPQVQVIPIRYQPEGDISDDCDVFAANISGFDLCSDKDADKLISFHLATTPPKRITNTGEIAFDVIIMFNVDCDSPECDNHKNVAGWLAGMAAGAAIGSNYGPAGMVAGALVGAFVPKLNVSTRYELDIKLSLVCGTSNNLAVTHHAHENSYSWGKDKQIKLEDKGILKRSLRGNGSSKWQACVPAINQISIEVSRERGFLKPDNAMHLLEWDMAVRPTSSTGSSCTVELDLFFRNWRQRESQFLDNAYEFPIFDEAIEDVLSHRDAGDADLTMGINLLQFAEPAEIKQKTRIDKKIHWEGKNASAKSEEAVNRKDKTCVIAAPETSVEAARTDLTSEFIALELYD